MRSRWRRPPYRLINRYEVVLSTEAGRIFFDNVEGAYFFVPNPLTVQKELFP